MATKKTVTKTTTRKRNGKVTKITTVIEEVVETKPKLTTHVLLLLDDSGSMADCYQEAVTQINENLAIARTKAAETGIETTVSLYLFGGGPGVRCLYQRRPIAEAKPLGSDFAYGGSTPLRDAICGAITDGFTFKDANDPNTSFLLLCATDGGENSSRRFAIEALPRLIKTALETGRWTPVFMVPRGHKTEMIACGVSADNILEWENSRRGAELGFQRTNLATASYMSMRGNGMKSTEKFYATTDLSKLTKAEVQGKLDDISHKFKAVEVTKEVDIKTFAEEKTGGRPYVVGSVFYALTKKEKVQPGKEVLIIEKGKKAVWGGAQARGLIGLPTGVAAIVTPGNHAQYDVYVKSTSVNRKLVRGTKILIDVTKTVSDAETWDSAAAKAAADAKAALLGQTPTP
jgi:hypothetical protein